MSYLVYRVCHFRPANREHELIPLSVEPNVVQHYQTITRPRFTIIIYNIINTFHVQPYLYVLSVENNRKKPSN